MVQRERIRSELGLRARRRTDNWVTVCGCRNEREGVVRVDSRALAWLTSWVEIQKDEPGES